MAFIEWNSKAIELTAKAEVTCNPSDSLRWEQRFTPALSDSDTYWNAMQFHGALPESDQGEITLDGGEYTVVQDNGDFNATGNNVSFYVDGSLQYVFADPGLAQEFAFSIPYGETKTVRALQTTGQFVASITVRQTQNYAVNGERPQVIPAGDTATVIVGRNNYTPSNGVLTLTPKVYNAEGAEVAAGNSISLIVNVSSSGGC